MKNSGRPGISYAQFVSTWEQLLGEGRAHIKAVVDELGGSKSTLIAFRDQYERELSAKKLTLLKGIELPDAVHKAIADIKIKEMEALEKENTQLKARIDEYKLLVEETEKKLSGVMVDMEDAKFQFDNDKLTLERQLAKSEGRIEDFKKREEAQFSKYEQLNKQCNEAKQEAAVAKKEVEMLREKRVDLPKKT